MLKLIRQIVIFIYLYAIHKSNTEEIEIQYGREFR